MATPFFDERIVFKAGTNNYDRFRIPAVIKAPNGHLLAFAEGRRKTQGQLGDHYNVDLVMKKSTDNGNNWGSLVSIWGHQFSDWTTFGNPCPVVDEDTGTIWLPFCEDNYEVWITKSTDNGNNWATPYKISDQVKNPSWAWGPKPTNADEEKVIWTGPGIGIQIKQGSCVGRLVIPCHFQPFPQGQHPGVGVENNRMWVFYSDDHGQTWNYPPLSELGNESQVVELSNQDLMLNGRNQKRFGGDPIRRLTAISSNCGVNFTDSIVDDELIEPVCQASILRYSFGSGDNNVILFSNPASSTKRERMTVRISENDTFSWPTSQLVREGPSAYSCLVKQADDNIGLLYETNNSKDLTYARFNLEWVRQNGGNNTILSTEWDNLSGWSTSGTDISINPASQLRLFDAQDATTKVFRSAQNIPSNYTIEFKAKVSQYSAIGKISLGVKVQDGSYRLMFQRKADGFYVIDTSNSWVRIKTTSEYTGWADYKIVVNNGSASLYARVSGTEVYNPNGNWNLQIYQQPDLIEHWVRGKSGQPAEVRFDWTRIY